MLSKRNAQRFQARNRSTFRSAAVDSDIRLKAFLTPRSQRKRLIDFLYNNSRSATRRVFASTLSITVRCCSAAQDDRQMLEMDIESTQVRFIRKGNHGQLSPILSLDTQQIDYDWQTKVHSITRLEITVADRV